MQEENQGATTQDSSSNMDVDSLLSSIDQPTQERQMSEAPPEAQTPEQKQQEFEFNWNGKKIKAPLDKLSQWASQGYDYGQKMAEFNKRQSEFQQQSKQVEEIKSKYSEIDDYVRQNPDWWQHVTQTYEQRLQQAGQNPQGADIRELIKAHTEEAIKPFKEQVEQQKQQELFKKQDAELDTQIQSVREKYSDLDFDAVGEDGKSLMYKVLEFGASNGLNNFDVAFKAFYHDDLIKREATRAKEAYSKDIQKRTKLGLLGTSPTPKQGISDAKYTKSKSYNDLEREALEELGIR